jgi:hypothetical protein
MTRQPEYATLTLRNPSDYSRGGVVVRKWQPVAKALGVRMRGARVERQRGQDWVQLDAQIDRLDPRDRYHDQLVFKLDEEIPGTADEHYGEPSGTVRVAAAGKNDPPRGVTVERYYTGVKFRNQRMEVWLNSAANKHAPDDTFYGGAVTSVILYNQDFYGRRYDIEALDAVTSLGCIFMPHPEARAMQVDRIHLVRPPWDKRRSVDVYPFRQPWRIVSVSEGPVRAVATIMSAPFEFRCQNPDETDAVFRCNVYRAISVYDGSDWIGDETWVKARDLSSGRSHRLWFTARYFMMVHFTDRATTFRYPDHPGWFAINQPDDPALGYAFATDAMAGAIWNPPLDYRDVSTEHRAFSWDLGTSRTTHCFHKFRCKAGPLQTTHDAGWLWYDLAFKRIRATLEGEK